MQVKKTFDEWLIYRIKTGDKKAFKLLAEKWYAKLIKHIFYITKDEDIAKDIAQDTWSVVVKKINTLKQPARFNIWLYKIASNKSRDWIKSEQKRRNIKETLKKTESNTFESESEDEEINEIVYKLKIAMKKLSSSKQQILNLFYQESCNIREISEIMNIPIGTVKSRLFNAREHLKKIVINLR